MIRFTATIEQFSQQGEKTGWSYIKVPAALAQQLNPRDRKAFRVKGKLDDHAFATVNLVPMGGGDYILAVNRSMRTAIRKQKGAKVQVMLEYDTSEPAPPPELMECLLDEPEALARFNSITKAHQHYFTNWISGAKTDPTKAKRIAATINALVRGWDFGQMVRSMKKEKMD
jgi:hypothetical protein